MVWPGQAGRQVRPPFPSSLPMCPSTIPGALGLCKKKTYSVKSRPSSRQVVPSLLWSQLAFSDVPLLMSAMVLLPESSQHLQVSSSHCPSAGLATSFSCPQPQASSRTPPTTPSVSRPGTTQVLPQRDFPKTLLGSSGNTVIYGSLFGEVSKGRELCVLLVSVRSSRAYNNLPFIARLLQAGDSARTIR